MPSDKHITTVFLQIPRLFLAHGEKALFSQMFFFILFKQGDFSKKRKASVISFNQGRTKGVTDSLVSLNSNSIQAMKCSNQLSDSNVLQSPSCPHLDVLFTPLPFLQHTFCDSLQSIPKPSKPPTMPHSQKYGSKRSKRCTSYDIFQHLPSIRESEKSVKCDRRSTQLSHYKSPTEYSCEIRQSIVQDVNEDNPGGSILKSTKPTEYLHDYNISLRNDVADMVAFLETVCSSNIPAISSHFIPYFTAASDCSVSIKMYKFAKELPVQLGGKNKYVNAKYSKRASTTDFNLGPHKFHGPITMIGKGVYGHAVKCFTPLHMVKSENLSTARSNDKQNKTVSNSVASPVILKIDHNHKHLVWEIVVHAKVSIYQRTWIILTMPHCQIQNRLKIELTTLQSGAMSASITYKENCLPPLALFTFHVSKHRLNKLAQCVSKLTMDCLTECFCGFNGIWKSWNPV